MQRFFPAPIQTGHADTFVQKTGSDLNGIPAALRAEMPRPDGLVLALSPMARAGGPQRPDRGEGFAPLLVEVIDPYFNGRQMSVRRSDGAVSRGLFR